MLIAQPLDGPIGSYASAGEIRRVAAGALRRRDIRVSAAAERHRMVNNPGSYVGPWRNAMAPYLVEPMDRTTDRGTGIVVLVGPSQFGKTEVPLCVITHAATEAPRDILLFQPTKSLALDFSQRRIDEKLLRASPRLAAALGTTRSDDRSFQKRFRNGAFLTIAWPSSSEISSRPVPVVILDERDTMPDDIAGEGDPVDLARARTKTFGTQAMVLVVSSPKRRDLSGVILLWSESDRCLWFVPCPHCEAYFSPGFGRDRRPLDVAPASQGPIAGFGGLLWTPTEDPEVARRSAAMPCPHCGTLITERHKRAMNEVGQWVPEAIEIRADGTLSAQRPPARSAGYWLSGLSSNFVAWGDLAAAYVAAEMKYREAGEEASLRAVVNTDFGFPFVGRDAGRLRISAEGLSGRADPGYALRTVPAEVVYLVAAVDVQGDRFEVAVRGFDRRNQSWLIDRYAIRQLDDGVTDIDPAGYLEHWDMIRTRVIEARYPLAADPGRGLRIATTAIDTGGLDGVAPNAYQAWIDWTGPRSPHRIHKRRVMLIKGANTATAPMVRPPSAIEHTDRQRKRVEAVDLYLLGVTELKKVVVRRLGRTEPGPAAMHTPRDTPPRYYAELEGERLEAGKWVRRAANESLDLEAYMAAAAMTIRSHRWPTGDWPWFTRPIDLGGPARDAAPDPPVPAVVDPAPPVVPVPGDVVEFFPVAPASSAPRRQNFARGGLA